jgi:trans-aconitate methyltransferase
VTLPASYFDNVYADAADPWGFTDRWYEQRKRDLTLAMLPQAQYASAFEAGCSIGVLTQSLATRCRSLLAVDISAAAVEAADQRCAELAHVTVQQAQLPADWPAGGFDLIVLSEIGYYFDNADLALVARRACAASQTLIAVHWRHPVEDYPLTGDMVHAALVHAAGSHGLTHLAEYRDADISADVWTRESRSVAQRMGLT